MLNVLLFLILISVVSSGMSRSDTFKANQTTDKMALWFFYLCVAAVGAVGIFGILYFSNRYYGEVMGVLLVAIISCGLLEYGERKDKKVEKNTTDQVQ